MGKHIRKCTICGQRNEILHSGRHMLEFVPQDVWVQRNRRAWIGWVVCKAGGLLCLTHPRLHAAFKPTEAMTPSNPRWKEFTEALTVSLKATGCKAGRDKIRATQVMESMGLHKTLIDASLSYFESHGGFCDCGIIHNIAMGRR